MHCKSLNQKPQITNQISLKQTQRQKRLQSNAVNIRIGHRRIGDRLANTTRAPVQSTSHQDSDIDCSLDRIRDRRLVTSLVARLGSVTSLAPSPVTWLALTPVARCSVARRSSCSIARRSRYFITSLSLFFFLSDSLSLSLYLKN